MTVSRVEELHQYVEFFAPGLVVVDRSGERWELYRRIREWFDGRAPTSPPNRDVYEGFELIAGKRVSHYAAYLVGSETWGDYPPIEKETT